MTFPSRKSIRFRLATILLPGFVVLLSVASVFVYYTTTKMLEQDFDSRLFAKAQVVTASISQKGAGLDVDWNEIPQELNPHKRPECAVRLIDGAGHDFFPDSPLTVLPVSASGGGLFRNSFLKGLGSIRVLSLAFRPHVEEEDLAVTPSRVREDCILMVAVSRASLDGSEHALAAILAVMVCGTSLLCVALVWLTLRRGLQPLDDLGAAVAQVKTESLGQKIVLDRLPEELAPIIDKLNGLMERLDISFARERRFSADVSHELRTPVAELKTLSEVMLQSGGHSAEVQQAFQDSRDIALQMESLVTILLEMVRQEEGRASLSLSETDLELQVQTVWQRHETKAAGKDIRLNLSGPEKTIWLRTDTRLLSMILSNLFDNAIEYSPLGSAVEVEFSKDEKSPCLVISNPAGDLASEDLPHLSERFWRKDKARREDGHFGLGLSLTKMMCERLGINMATSLDEGLVRFKLQFPVSHKSE